MSLPEINITCKKCNANSTTTPEQSFLGFQKITCQNCGERLLYPLTKGYRIAYFVLLILMGIMLVNGLKDGNVGFPGGIGIAIIIALVRDCSIRKKGPKILGRNNFLKNIMAIITVLIVLAVGVVVQRVGTETLKHWNKNTNEEEINRDLMQSSDDMNKNLPRLIDSETRLDSTFVLNKVFFYKYTVINYAESEIDMDYFNNIMIPRMRNSACTSKSIRSTLENGVTYTYLYHDKEGRQFSSFDIKLNNCSQ